MWPYEQGTVPTGIGLLRCFKPFFFLLLVNFPGVKYIVKLNKIIFFYLSLNFRVCTLGLTILIGFKRYLLLSLCTKYLDEIGAFQEKFHMTRFVVYKWVLTFGYVYRESCVKEAWQGNERGRREKK